MTDPPDTALMRGVLKVAEQLTPGQGLPPLVVVPPASADVVAPAADVPPCIADPVEGVAVLFSLRFSASFPQISALSSEALADLCQTIIHRFCACNDEGAVGEAVLLLLAQTTADSKVVRHSTVRTIT